MKKKKLNGRGCRKKGHDFERWVAQELRGVYPDARRHLEYHSRDANGVDIINTGDYLFQLKKLIMAMKFNKALTFAPSK